jgi:hypothetical protein
VHYNVGGGRSLAITRPRLVSSSRLLQHVGYAAAKAQRDKGKQLCDLTRHPGLTTSNSPETLYGWGIHLLAPLAYRSHSMGDLHDCLGIPGQSNLLHIRLKLTS